MDRTSKFATVAVAGILAYWLYQSLKSSAASDTSGVTKTQKGGLTTTPVQESKLAFLADPIGALFKATSKGLDTAKTLLSSTIQVRGADKFLSFGSPQSAQAAYDAPLRPEYRATLYTAPSLGAIVKPADGSTK